MDTLSTIPSSAGEMIAGMPDPDSVRKMEAALLQLPQVDLKTSMLIHGGMSARTIFIPAGTMLTGALTNCENICVLFGDITVTTDDGPKRLTGFNVIPANAGAKRAGVTHSDTWWTTIHRTEYSDIADIEAEMTSESDRLQTRTLSIGHEQHPSLENQP